VITIPRKRLSSGTGELYRIRDRAANAGDKLQGEMASTLLFIYTMTVRF
jgi:hypothetical protein